MFIVLLQCWQREKKSAVESQKISLLELMKKQITVKRQRDFLDSDEESVVSYKLYQELQDSYVMLKKRLREKDVIIAEKDTAIRKLSEKCRRMSVELDKIRQLNICLQEQLFLKDDGLKDFFVSFWSLVSLLLQYIYIYSYQSL